MCSLLYWGKVVLKKHLHFVHYWALEHSYFICMSRFLLSWIVVFFQANTTVSHWHNSISPSTQKLLTFQPSGNASVQVSYIAFVPIAFEFEYSTVLCGLMNSDTPCGHVQLLIYIEREFLFFHIWPQRMCCHSIERQIIMVICWRAWWNIVTLKLALYCFVLVVII